MNKNHLKENEYWDRDSFVSKNANVLSLGLVEFTNVVKNPNELINSIESLDKEITSSKIKTTLQSWQPWNYSYTNKNNTSFCFSKYIPEVEELYVNDVFYEKQLVISKQIHNAVNNSLLDYYNIYPRSEKNIEFKERFGKLLKYEKNNFMPMHSDHGTTSRVLSCVLYLNENYSGGELYFPYLNLTIKPRSGSIIFFPSNFIYSHEVKIINDGIRYSFPTWFHNTRKIKLPENPKIIEEYAKKNDRVE